MIAIIDVLRKTIRVEDEELNFESQDFSWIPSNVTYVRWYGSEGQIQYAADENGNVIIESITELGIYEQAIEMFNNEKQRLEEVKKAEEEAKKAEEEEAQAEAIEAARDYWKELRYLRDEKLTECDWTQIADAPLTEEQKTAWRTYRQALRDLPANIEDPKPLVNDINNPQWPVI